MQSITACKSRQGIIKLVKLILLLLLIFGRIGLVEQPAPVIAQTVQWSPQQRIPGYLDTTRPPILVADSTGVVHAFAYQEVSSLVESEEVAIIYSTWSFESGWTLPNDVILSPIRRQAQVMDVYLDPQGIFHLIFHGGNEQEAYLFYSRVHISEAIRATSWSKPVVIGEQPLTPSLAKLTGDGQGNLLVIYSGNLDGPGLFLVNSTDYGNTWGSPEPFFLTYNRFHRPAVINWYQDPSDILHLVWQISNDIGHNVSAYYAQTHFPSAGNWTTPMPIDEAIGADRGMGVADPSVIEHNGQVIIVYNNGIPPEGVPPTMWGRYSTDGGLTWSERIRISNNHVGRNGPATFVVDSRDQLHVFYGMRVPIAGSAIHGLWHNTWQNGYWSETTSIVSGPPTSSFDPSLPHAVASQGNRLLVTWFTDPGLSDRGVWYSTTELNTPLVQGPPLPVKAETYESTPHAATSDRVSPESNTNGERQEPFDTNLWPMPDPGLRNTLVIPGMTVLGLLIAFFVSRRLLNEMADR